MTNIDLFSLLPVLIIGFVLFIIVLVILRRIFVNVGAREIAIKERRYMGRRMPPGRVVATEGEVGIQAEVLKPGLHLIKYPFERIVRKVPLIEIGADELGIIEAMDGEPMSPGNPLPSIRGRSWRRAITASVSGLSRKKEPFLLPKATTRVPP